jgi:hypothetical protein
MTETCVFCRKDFVAQSPGLCKVKHKVEEWDGDCERVPGSGAWVEEQCVPINQKDANGMTALMHASRAGCAAVVQYIALKCPATVNDMSSLGNAYGELSIDIGSIRPSCVGDGWTALFFAAFRGDVATVKCLVECQADPGIVCREQSGEAMMYSGGSFTL